jgi:hypothetical protein
MRLRLRCISVQQKNIRKKTLQLPFKINFQLMDSLPDEIIVQIFEYLAAPIVALDGPTQNTTALYHLCLVSRRFNHIATAFLFRTYEHNSTPFSALRLLRVIQRRPVLAENIKVIRHKAAYKHFMDESEYPPIDRVAVLLASEKLKIPESANMEWRMGNTGDDLELAMLLFQTPKLERLYVRTWKHKLDQEPSWQMPLWVVGITHIAHGDAFGNVHRFSTLRHLYLDVHRIEATPFFPFFTMPSLAELTLCHWGEMAVFEEDPEFVYGRQWTWPLRENNIERLILKLPFVSSKTVSNAILSCKALKYFEVHEYSLEIESTGWNWYSGLSTALAAQGDSLEELIVTDTYHLDLAQDIGFLDLLYDLSHLRVLKIPFYILVGPEGSRLDGPDSSSALLPLSIEKLIILYDEETELTHASRYFHVLQSACTRNLLPNLATIQLRCRFTHHWIPVDIWDVDLSFRNYGIALEYYVQLCIWKRRRPFSDNRRNMPTREDLALIQDWVMKLKRLPNVIRLEYEGRNIVATNLSGTTTMVEDKRYEKRHPDDLRWRLY